VENSVKDLAKHMTLDNLKYGPLVPREKRLQILEKQNQLLKEMREAAEERERMFKEEGL
jgi:hypothetical protein